MDLRLENAEAVLDSLEELEEAYNEYYGRPVLSHTAAYIEQQLDAIADMKKDLRDALKARVAA